MINPYQPGIYSDLRALARRPNLVLILLLLALSGCSLFSPQPITDKPLITYSWPKVSAELEQFNSWSLMGKIGVQTKNESMTALINNWIQMDDNFSVDLSSSFFGLGASRLQGTSEFITLIKAGEEPVSSDLPDELLESALGIPLPITYLHYWIKALPVPEQAFVIEFNEQGLPATLVQYNWHLRFSNYAIHQNTTHQNLPLPGKITLEQADSRIILAIKKWTLPSP